MKKNLFYLALLGLNMGCDLFGRDDDEIVPASIGILNSDATAISTYAFASTEEGQETEVALTLKNNGGTSATGLTAVTAVATAGAQSEFSFKGGTFPGTGGDCPSTLAAGASCTLVLVFESQTDAYTTETLEGTMTLFYESGAGAVSSVLNLTATGTNCLGDATALISQSGISVGSATVLSAATQRVAQSFFWNESKKFKSITLSQYKGTGTTLDSITVAIHGDCDGIPCETALASYSGADPGLVADSRTEFTYTLSSPLTIEADETYWMVISATNISGAVYIDKYTSNGYGGGNFASSSDSGATYSGSAGSGDLTFDLNACSDATVNY